MSLYVTLVVLIHVIDKGVETSNDVKILVAENIPSYNDVHTNNIVISTQYSENIYDCLGYCLEESRCISIFFHDNNKICQTNDMEIGSYTAYSGWKYYLISSRKGNGYGGWSVWSAWGLCSQSVCGTGTRSRTRSCNLNSTCMQEIDEETETCLNDCSTTIDTTDADVSTTTSHVYIGCFDGSTVLVLDGMSIYHNRVTLQNCASLCSKGYIFFGIKAGTECWCGNLYSNTQTTDNKCMLPCAGNSSQTRCGGSTYVAVYKI